MNGVRRKGSLLVTGLLLMGGGIGVGALASSLTSASIAWRPPSRFAMTEPALPTPVDQAGAGRSWARSAFVGGLRRCPEMNAAFLAACEAEMKALIERPALLHGSYGGPLLVTKFEPAQKPRIEPDRPTEPEMDLPLIEGPAVEPIEAEAEPTPANYPAAPSFP